MEKGERGYENKSHPAINLSRGQKSLRTATFTFSKVVSAMPKKPETKNASTQYREKDSEITESSKVIIARIKRQNQNTQNNQKSSSKNNNTQTTKPNEHKFKTMKTKSHIGQDERGI